MTKIYGASDDLIELEGDIYDEVDVLSLSKDVDKPIILTFDDNTKVRITYNNNGIWKIKPLVVGHLFDKIDECLEESDDRYSDCLIMKDGLESYTTEVEKW